MYAREATNGNTSSKTFRSCWACLGGHDDATVRRKIGTNVISQLVLAKIGALVG